MKAVKKYTAIQLETNNVNDELEVALTYGDIKGPYYDREYPRKEFDTEEEAIEYAYKRVKWGRWLVLPIVTFEND